MVLNIQEPKLFYNTLKVKINRFFSRNYGSLDIFVHTELYFSQPSNMVFR